MPNEKRLVTFSEGEVRKALLMLPAAARGAAWDESNGIGLGKSTAAIVKLADGSDFEMAGDKVGAALLLYCKAEKIPIPKHGTKSLRRDETGLTLVIDVAEALLSTPWQTYDAPLLHSDNAGANRSQTKKCPKCGATIVLQTDQLLQTVEQ